MTYRCHRTVLLSPDGNLVATAGFDGTVRIWKTITGDEIARMSHDARVPWIDFSPDGKHIATASYDAARVWEIMTGREVARIGHGDAVISVAFSPDGKYLATASIDKAARTWLVWPEDLIAEAVSRLTRNLTYQEWQQYLPNEPYCKTCPNLPIHPSFIESGRDLAKAGDLDGAVVIFRRAVELEPNLELDPEEEAHRISKDNLPK